MGSRWEECDMKMGSKWEDSQIKMGLTWEECASNCDQNGKNVR